VCAPEQAIHRLIPGIQSVCGEAAFNFVLFAYLSETEFA
jgi:hypothetical protein